MYGRGFNGGGVQFGPPVTPPVVKNLMIAVAVIWVLQILTQDQFKTALSVNPLLVWREGWLWQPFTYMWIHSGFFHGAVNCFMLWMFGSQMAMAWGDRRFLRFYLICGIGAGFIISLWPLLAYGIGIAGSGYLLTSTLGASGAVYGVVLAYSMTWPDRQVMFFPFPISFRAIWIIPILFGLQVMMSGPSSNISHLGHLGGVLVGWLYMRRTGRAGPMFSLSQLKYRWNRYRMRQKLRAVRMDEFKDRKQRSDDRTIH